MKQNITISLDHEVIAKLRQEGNMSGTINKLLAAHLGGGETKETLQTAIDMLKLTIEQDCDEVDRLRDKLSKIPAYKVYTE